MREVTRILRFQRALRRLRAVGERNRRSPIRFESDHHLHAGEQFARLCRPNTWMIASVTPASISTSNSSSSFPRSNSVGKQRRDPWR